MHLFGYKTVRLGQIGASLGCAEFVCVSLHVLTSIAISKMLFAMMTNKLMKGPGQRIGLMCAHNHYYIASHSQTINED